MHRIAACHPALALFSATFEPYFGCHNALPRHYTAAAAAAAAAAASRHVTAGRAQVPQAPSGCLSHRRSEIHSLNSKPKPQTLNPKPQTAYPNREQCDAVQDRLLESTSYARVLSLFRWVGVGGAGLHA